MDPVHPIPLSALPVTLVLADPMVSITVPSSQTPGPLTPAVPADIRVDLEAKVRHLETNLGDVMSRLSRLEARSHRLLIEDDLMAPATGPLGVAHPAAVRRVTLTGSTPARTTRPHALARVDDDASMADVDVDDLQAFVDASFPTTAPPPAVCAPAPTSQPPPVSPTGVWVTPHPAKGKGKAGRSYAAATSSAPAPASAAKPHQTPLRTPSTLSRDELLKLTRPQLLVAYNAKFNKKLTNPNLTKEVIVDLYLNKQHTPWPTAPQSARHSTNYLVLRNTPVSLGEPTRPDTGFLVHDLQCQIIQSIFVDQPKLGLLSGRWLGPNSHSFLLTFTGAPSQDNVFRRPSQPYSRVSLQPQLSRTFLPYSFFYRHAHFYLTWFPSPPNPPFFHTPYFTPLSLQRCWTLNPFSQWNSGSFGRLGHAYLGGISGSGSPRYCCSILPPDCS